MKTKGEKMAKMTKSKYIIYGMGVSYFMLDQLYNQWMPYYYLPPETEMNLEPLINSTYLVITFIIARLIDAISDPLVGYWSDNSKAKMGKRSFFMALGGLPLGIFMVMYFFPPKSSQLMMLIYLSVLGGLFFSAYTLVGGPYNALIPDLAKTKEDQLNLSTVQSTFRLIFTGIALVLPGMLIKLLGGGNTEAGIRKTVILLTLFAVAGIYICVFFLKERELVEKSSETRKLGFGESLKYIMKREIILYFMGFVFFFSGFNILRGILTYYLTIIMKLPIEKMTLITGLLFGVAGICFPITNKLGKKYSYKKILILDILLLIIGTGGLLLINGKTGYMAYVMFVICGMGLSGSAFIFPQAMLSEISVKISEKEKVGLEGFLFGIQGLFLKLAFMAQQVIVPLVIVIGSPVYNKGLKRATDLGVRGSLMVALVFFGVSLFFYKMKKEN